jgi:hypothetical protein
VPSTMQCDDSILNSGLGESARRQIAALSQRSRWDRCGFAVGDGGKRPLPTPRSTSVTTCRRPSSATRAAPNGSRTTGKCPPRPQSTRRARSHLFSCAPRCAGPESPCLRIPIPSPPASHP